MTEENSGQGREQGEGRSREGGGGEGKKMVEVQEGKKRDKEESQPPSGVRIYILLITSPTFTPNKQCSLTGV